MRGSEHLSPNVLLVTRQRWMGHISFAPGICPVCLTFSCAAGYSNARLRLAVAPEIYWRFQFCVSECAVRRFLCESVAEIMGDGSGLRSLNQDAENAF